MNYIHMVDNDDMALICINPQEICQTYGINVVKTPKNQPCLGMVSSTYKNGDDWGMVYECC